MKIVTYFWMMFKKKTACACRQCLKRLHIAKNALLKQRQRRSCPLTGAAILFSLWVIFSQLNGAAHFMSFSPLYKRDLIASTIPTFHQQLNCISTVVVLLLLFIANHLHFGQNNKLELWKLNFTSDVFRSRCKFKMSMPPSRAQSEVLSASQYGAPMNQQTPRVNYFIIPIFVLEIIGLACLWALFYYLRFTSVFPYHERVFSCNDATLAMPNLNPNQFLLYVSYDALYCVSFIIPPFVILLGELMFWLFSTKPRKVVHANCREFTVHLFTRRLLRFISVYIFGALIVCILIDTIKLMTGFHRPYFLTQCNPNYEKYCKPPLMLSPDMNPSYACNVVHDADFRSAWLSFPSLHAGLSSFAAIFTSCYVHYMISLRGAPLLRPFLIFGFIGMSVIASFSFVQGYKNHWLDVWVGWLIGVACAFYLCHNVLCFQEFYHVIEDERRLPQEHISPFFSWFRLPRVNAKDPTYSVYAEEESPAAMPPAGASSLARHKGESGRNMHRTYEVTTTTESFQRTVTPAHQAANIGENF
ncbi:PAP2 family protein [Trichinella nativa]|uniref:PAP2 family protein n=1 Tax=Trichinella nativa TaxID=6335 RepID=A0A1Y3EVC2_9BILA|nr:PAP2 family protein [Trichinella nativa]